MPRSSPRLLPTLSLALGPVAVMALASAAAGATFSLTSADRAPRPAETAPSGETTSRTVISAAADVRPARATPDPDCGPIEGVSELAAEPVLLFGELHGTDLPPAAFAEVVCHLARAHGEAVVGLEISHTEQERIDAFLAGTGTGEDRRGLLEGAFWTDPYQDGRRSRAMVQLLERLRELRASGIDLEVVAFDPLPDVDFRDREEGMAANLAEVRRSHPDEPFAVLAGNFHPRTVRGTRWDPDFVPLGARLEAAGFGVLPIDVRHAGGSAWICTGSSAEGCGPRSVGGPGEPRATPELELFAEPEPSTGYAGALWVGEVEASPPAVGEAEPAELPAPPDGAAPRR